MMQRRTSQESGYPNRSLLTAVSNDSLETLQHSTYNIYFSSLKQCVSKQDHLALHSALKDMVIKCGQKKERTRGIFVSVLIISHLSTTEFSWLTVVFYLPPTAEKKRKDKLISLS